MKKWYMLFWVSIAQIFALSLWFSATAILPSLKEMWNLNNVMEVWVTSSVQIGFIIGAFISSYFGFTDRFNSRKVFIFSALIGSLINVVLIFVSSAMIVFLLRFLTGVTLAGVYPTAVKIISQWFPKHRGLAIGIVIGALTLGSALPHFMVAFFSVNWKWVIICSSIFAFGSSIIMSIFVKDVPIKQYTGPVSFQLLKKVIKNKPISLANFGYFGHMWELYAMWTWLPVFINECITENSPDSPIWISAISSFLTIGIGGAIGCIVGGLFSDRIGRSRLTIVAMSISACCSILIGFFMHSYILILIISFIWGMSVIADSAQFSAAVTEFAEKESVGTALAFQMAVGFFITIISINFTGYIQKYVGWEWAFSFLSIGPIIGIFSMYRLKSYEQVQVKKSI